MTPEERSGLDALRKFLKPTFRGKIRGLIFRLRRMLFPPKPIQLFRSGDLIWISGQEKIVAKCRGPFVEFTDGTEMTVAL